MKRKIIRDDEGRVLVAVTFFSEFNLHNPEERKEFLEKLREELLGVRERKGKK